jgi:hypothetical protein
MKNNLKYSCVIRTLLSTVFFTLTVGTADAAIIVDFSAEVGVVQTGGIVTEWRDQSGNSNNATTATPVGPVYTTAVVNGRSHPVLRFDGNNFLIAPPHVPATGTLFLVLSNIASPGFSCVIGWEDSLVGQYGFGIFPSVLDPADSFTEKAFVVARDNFSVGDILAAPSITDMEVMTVSWGATGVTLERRLASGEVLTFSNPAITSVSDGFKELHIGAASDPYPFVPFQGDMAALRVYNEQLGAAERATIANTFYSNWIGIGFVGTPNQANCHGKSVSALPPQVKGGLKHAATALGFDSIKELQDAISAYCGN